MWCILDTLASVADIDIAAIRQITLTTSWNGTFLTEHRFYIVPISENITADTLASQAHTGDCVYEIKLMNWNSSKHVHLICSNWLTGWLAGWLFLGICVDKNAQSYTWTVFLRFIFIFCLVLLPSLINYFMIKSSFHMPFIFYI